MIRKLFDVLAIISSILFFVFDIYVDESDSALYIIIASLSYLVFYAWLLDKNGEYLDLDNQ